MKKLNVFVVLALFYSTLATAANVTFNVTVPNDPSKPTTHMTNSVWIVGSYNGWNINYSQQLTKVDDTHYTITMDDATWGEWAGVQVTTANVKYKYLSGGADWTYIEKLADGSEPGERIYNALVNDVVERWALTWRYTEPIPKTVTISAIVPVNVNQLYIVGNFNGWALLTDSTEMILTETNANSKIFSVIIFSNDLNKLQYRFVAGPAWEYQQTTNYTYPDVTQNTAIEIVTGFNKYFDPTKVGNINITATVPAGTERAWIKGSHLGWNLEEGIKNIDGTFTFVAKNVTAIEYKLYNNISTLTHPEAMDGNPTFERPYRTATFPDDANTAITVSAWLNAAPNFGSEIISSTAVLNGLNSDITAVNSFVVRGIGLSSNIIVTPLTGLEISTSPTSGFSNAAITLQKSGLEVVSTTIYVKLSNSLSNGNFTQLINLSSAGVTTKSITCSGIVGPIINLSSAFINVLNYDKGNGPSSERAFTIGGLVLEGDIILTPSSTNLQISKTSGSGFSSNPITLSNITSSVPNTTIYVRLKAGLIAGVYSENINISSSNAITKVVKCKGMVLGNPNIITSVNTINSLNYDTDNGPSDQQSFTISGSDLNENIVITPNTNFQISIISGSSFSINPITLTKSGVFINNTTVYVRLKAGLSDAFYTGDIVITSTNADTKRVVCNGRVGTTTSSISKTENAINVYGQKNKILITGINKGELIQVYDLNGKQVYSETANNEFTSISVQSDALYLVKTAGKTFKVKL